MASLLKPVANRSLAPVDTLLADERNIQVVKYAAGRTMFCPWCGRCLDWSDACYVEVGVDGEHCTSFCACGACSDAETERFKDSWVEQLDRLTITVTDGRYLSHPRLPGLEF